jgi:acetyltransferase
MSPELSSLDPVFKPTSIAVIGASHDPQKFSGMIIPGLVQVGYKGKIYPVNPNRDEICGLKCYKSVSALPEAPELAIVAVPSARARVTLNECIAAGAKASVVVSAGIEYESGDPIREETKLVAHARQRGMRICGPNCEGAIYLSTGTWATFLSYPSPKKGDVALITHSGGVGEFVLHKMWDRMIGASGWVSPGNEIDLQAADYIEYFAQDNETKAISIFLEAARDGPRFIKAARFAFEQQKPLVVLKVGRSERARIAALTHTGAIAGKHSVYVGLFRQLGIVRAKNLQELVDLPLALAWEPLPSGNRVAVIADSGGMAALLADIIDQEGLAMPDLEQQTRAEMARVLPRKAKVGNPLDITALVGATEVASVLESVGKIILQDKACDILIFGISYWPESVYFEVLTALGRLFKTAKDLSKPILPLFTAISTKSHQELLSRASDLKLPIYLTPEEATASARALAEYGGFRREGI